MSYSADFKISTKYIYNCCKSVFLYFILYKLLHNTYKSTATKSLKISILLSKMRKLFNY